MADTRVRFVVFDEVMYRGNGIVKKWMVQVTSRFSANAKAACPKRSGALAGSIRGTTATTGPRQCNGNIGVGGVRAPYARYVLGGTPDTIFPKNGPFLRVRAGGPKVNPGGAWKVGYWAVSKRKSVSGQPANNFMFKAWDRTARTNPAIKRNATSAHLNDF